MVDREGGSGEGDKEAKPVWLAQKRLNAEAHQPLLYLCAISTTNGVVRTATFCDA